MQDSTGFAALAEAVVAASHRLAAVGAAQGTAGNVSARSGDWVAVTATGASLESITRAEVTVVDLEGRVVAGELAPTSELPLHLGIYRASSAGAVVHGHPRFCTTVGLVTDELPVVHYEQLLLGGPIRVAPFAVFGTPELAAHVGAALDGRRAALLANHGAVAHGADLASAVRHLALLEFCAELYWRASAVGTPRSLTPAEQAAVVAHAQATAYGRTRGAR